MLGSAALSAHHCITSPSHGGPRTTWRLGGVDNQAATIEVDGPFQANTSSAQLEAALAGLGIALLPVALSAAHIDAGRLKEVLPAYTSGAIGVHFVYHSRRQLPRAVSAFIEFAANTIKELGLMDIGQRGASSMLER